MNFIDRYKQELNEEEGITEEQLKKLQEAVTQATSTYAFNAEDPNTALRNGMTGLANIYCDVAEVFLQRLKGKLTTGKIVQIILQFIDAITEITING